MGQGGEGEWGMRENSGRPQPYTKNYRQLRKDEIQRNILPQIRVY